MHKPLGFRNWIKCDCCSIWYHTNCVNKTLSDSKNNQWFHCTMCVNLKSRAPLAENVSDKMNDTFYNLEKVTYSPVFLYFFLFFLEQPKKNCRKQTTAMSSIKNKKKLIIIVSLPKPLPQTSSLIQQISSRK